MSYLKQYLPVTLAALVGVIIGGFVLGRSSSGPAAVVQTGGGFPGGTPVVLAGKDCKITEEQRVVRGESLAGVLENGNKVRVEFDYYNCKDVNRGDIVIYHYAGSVDPLVKIVKAIPGDKWDLKPSGNSWNIIVNGEALKTAQGAPYLVGGHGYLILFPYLRDYKGIMPGNTYIILGNNANGSLDSTSFGLVDKGDFLGKVAQ